MFSFKRKKTLIFYCQRKRKGFKRILIKNYVKIKRIKWKKTKTITWIIKRMINWIDNDMKLYMNHHSLYTFFYWKKKKRIIPSFFFFFLFLLFLSLIWNIMFLHFVPEILGKQSHSLWTLKVLFVWLKHQWMWFRSMEKH